MRGRTSCLILVAICFLVGAQANAAEPAWWTNQKRACGLSPSLAYETWRRQGFPCGGNGGGGFEDIERRERELRFERQLQQQLEEAAAREAARKQHAADADEAGMREAGRGNWQGAADHFIDALQFAPESTAIREHLNRANRELADTASAADIAALRARINDAIAASGIEALRQRRLDEVNAQRLAGMIADFRSHAVLARRPSNSNGYGTYLRVALLPHPIPANSPAGRVLISKQEQIKRIDEQLQRTQESLRRLIKSNRLNEELSLEWQKESAEASVDAQDLLISLVIDGIGAYVSEMEETDNKERAKVLDHLFGRGEENANSSIHSAYGALVNRRVELARIQEELRFASKENDLRIKIRDFSMDKGRAYTLENLYDVVTQWKKVEDLAGPYKDLSDAAYTIYRQVESWQILTTVKENGENNLRAAALLQQQIRKLVIQKQALKASSAR